MAEWSKAAVLRTVFERSEGSNPSLFKQTHIFGKIASISSEQIVPASSQITQHDTHR